MSVIERSKILQDSGRFGIREVTVVWIESPGITLKESNLIFYQHAVLAKIERNTQLTNR